MPTSQMVFNCKMYVSRVFIGLAIMLYEQLPVHHALLFNYCKGMQKSLDKLSSHAHPTAYSCFSYDPCLSTAPVIMGLN